MIKDSGNRREFVSGAVRDIQEGKGRCDLLPLDIVSDLFDVKEREQVENVLRNVYKFMESGETKYLSIAILYFVSENYKDVPTALLEVSKHFEEGCKKYGEHNWKLGINAKHYIDSGVRHYLKFRRGDTDEPHDRAFMWNLMCCIWTCRHKPELNDYAIRVKQDSNNKVKR